MLRSIGVIAGGFVFIGAVATGVDVVVRAVAPGAFASGRVDDVPLLLFMIAYVGVIATAGCYLTARFARTRPMLHAMILGVLGLVFNVLGTVRMWSTAPAWYHVVSLALVLPYAWAGGRIRERQLADASGRALPQTA